MYKSFERWRTFVSILIVIILFMGFLYFLYKSYRHYFRASPLYVADLSDVTDNSLGHYYVHTRGELIKEINAGIYSTPPFDIHGIPLVDYQGNIGRQYNPVTISQYGLENWDAFLMTKDTNHVRTFFHLADWLCENHHAGRWLYDFEIKARSLNKGWTSAMAQGQAMSLLLRAYQSSGKIKYLNVAKKALGVLQRDVRDGGVALADENIIWFEEYPNADNPGHVLNGHIYTLFGIWDYYRVTSDSSALIIFEKGVRAVARDIRMYDTGYWVLYEQNAFDLLNGTYMDLQIDQLAALYALTKNDIFREYSERWERYYHNPLILPVLLVKKVFGD